MPFLEQVDLSLDELEALRLSDYEGLNMEAGAKKMKISRSTFQRLTSSAHKKIIDSLINGKAIQIHHDIDFNFPGRLGKKAKDRSGVIRNNGARMTGLRRRH